MKLTESKLRQIVREELAKLSEKKPDTSNVKHPDVMQKKNVKSSFPSADEGKVFAYDQKNDQIQKVTPGTAEEKDKYRKPKPEELSNYNESVTKLKNIIRNEVKKKAINELSFREDKMRELLSRQPKLERIREEEGLSLKDVFDMYVKRNKRMKRKYKQASPQG